MIVLQSFFLNLAFQINELRNIFKILFFITFFSSSCFLYSQNQKYIKKLHTESLQFFNNEDYQKALPILIELDSLEAGNFETKYYLGVCYLNSSSKDKAIKYLEYAIKNNESSIPADVFKDMGEIYLQKNQFTNALNYFVKYQRITPQFDQSQSNISTLLENTKNAKKLFKDSVDVKIEKLDKKINNDIKSEYLPIISADDSHLFYVSSIKFKNSASDSLKFIMHSIKENGNWKTPQVLEFEVADNQYELAGISSDAQIIYLKFNNNLYLGNLSGNKCINIKELKGINSEYWEYFMSSTPEGNEMYFSSNNLGGLSGRDLYKIVKKEDGTWSTPKNLGNKINTALDEDFPFIHPDKKTLYFVSKGHNSMGGFDIFKSISLGKNIWSKPKNVGYPINTTNDDLSFSITANGNTAYVSRTQENNSYLNDIYKVIFNNNVPLTLVKGTILAGTPLKPIFAKLRVIDKELNSVVKYVYNPNPNNGKFLLIFPPGKNYDLIIEAEGFLPQLVNIYVPNQTYFYELYQEINLKSITSLGKIVGEQVTVKNTFYDINSISDSISNTIDTITKNYNVLLQIIEDIINSTDSLQKNEISFLSDNLYSVSEKNNKSANKDYSNLLNLINKAISTTDSTTLNVLEKNTIYIDKTSQSYFYAENKMNKLVPYVINFDTIFTVQPVNTQIDKESEHIIPNLSVTNIKSDSIHVNKITNDIDLNILSSENKKIILSYTIPYEQNAISFSEKYSYDLVEITQLILNNEGLYLDINGFTETGDQLNVHGSILASRVNAVIGKLLAENISYNKLKSSEFVNSKKINKIDLIVYEIIDYENKNKNLLEKTVQNKSQNLSEFIFRIQLKALIKKEESDSKLFNGIKVERIYHNGLYKYISGEFSDLQIAKEYLKEVKKQGFEDAFIVVFKNGSRLEQSEAIKLMKELELN